MKDAYKLPVWLYKDKIIEALACNRVVIVESPTGSGKTTQIPLMLNSAGYSEKGMIGITQPRRIAAVSVCSYIKKQLNDNDCYCGYKIRFYDTTSKSTKIKILTDGMLLQEFKSDPYLTEYSVIMVDEAHERSLNIDFILGLLKQLLFSRPDLKIIVSSATINTKVFSKFFNAPVISIKAQQYKVDEIYFPFNKKDEKQMYLNICTIINKTIKDFTSSMYKDSKDTLVFLPGEFEIKTCMNYIYSNCNYSQLLILPLYGKLNKDEQEHVFEDTPQGKIKVVLATNIAETSITIDNIKIVIDCGLSKMNKYNQLNFSSSLTSQPISKASAIQRKGRAGRTSEGICYRLYSQSDFNKRNEYTTEEILRTDLSEVVLQMIDLGIKNFDSFPFITPPEKNSLRSGVNTLLLLQAIDKNLNLTSIGKIMVAFPLLPRHSRCMTEALLSFPSLIENIAVCVSFLSCKSPFLLPVGEEDIARKKHRKFSSVYGDFIGYQNLYYKYRNITSLNKGEQFCNDNYLDFQSMEEIVHVSEQLCLIASDMGFPIKKYTVTYNENFAKECLVCMGKGLLQYVCVKTKNLSYRTLTVDEIYIHPGSAWFKSLPQFIIAGDLVFTTKMFARTVSPLKKEWLDDISHNLNKKLVNLLERKKTNISDNISEIVSDKKTKKFKFKFFDYNFDVIYENEKKQIIIIPFNMLSKVLSAYKKTSRHPKNILSAVFFNGFYIGWGDKLIENLMLSSRVKFNISNIVKQLPEKIFYENNLDELGSYLSLLMKFFVLKKTKNRLGFIELIFSKNSCFFHVNKNFNEALNNSAYTVLSLIDSKKLTKKNEKLFKITYNNLLKLLD